LLGGALASTGGWARRSSAYLLVAVVLLVMALAGTSRALAVEETEVESDAKPHLVLVPRIGIALEYGGLLVRRGDFSSAFRYNFLIDLLQYGPHLLYTVIEGEIDWGTPGLALEYNRTRHNLDIIGYRYDLGNYYVGCQFYHFCNNPFRNPGVVVSNQHEHVVYGDLHDRTANSAYFVGLQFVDKAMLLGQKDRGIVFDPARSFEFLWRFHPEVYLNREISQTDSNVNWLFSGRVRLDMLRFHNLIPYVEAGGDLLGLLKQWSFVPKVETGVRLHWKNAEFTPFVQWGHTEEWLRIFQNPSDGPFIPKVIHFESRSYMYAGGRLEFLLDRESIASRMTGAQWQFFPEVHGQGNYGLYLGSRYNYGTGGLTLNLDLIRWQHLNLFSNLAMHMETLPTDFSLDKVLYSVDYGLRYDWPKIFLEGFGRSAARVDVSGHDQAESPNLAGARIGTQGIRLGHYDDGIDFNSPERFQWLNKFNAAVSLGHYFNSVSWPATWNVTAQARWDVLRRGHMIPFVEGGLEFADAHRHSQDVVEYYVQPGLRFHGVMDLAVYYRWQHRETILSFNGPTENQNLLGFQVLF
jgi:hypothetical protein